MAETDKVEPTFFIPQSTQDNYLQIARDAAAANGGTAKAALDELATDFERRHKDDPTGGYDHLAAWAKSADPDEAAGPSALALAQARAVESARRDPTAALQGSPEVVAEAVNALQAQTADVSSVGNDPATGFVANPGPIPVEAPAPAVDAPAPAAEPKAAAPAAAAKPAADK